MTIQSEIWQNKYTGTGLVKTYPYTFKITDESHLEVLQADLNATETVLVLNTDYTVTDVGEESGGNAVLSANLPDQYRLVITRKIPVTQPTALENQGPFFAKTHEDVFDRNCGIDQQIQEQLDRCVKVKKSSDTEPEDFDESTVETLAKMQEIYEDTKQYADDIIMNRYEMTGYTGQTEIDISGEGWVLASSLDNISVYIEGVKQHTSTLTRTSDYILTLGGALTGGEAIELRSAEFSISASTDAAASAANAAASAGTAAESAAAAIQAASALSLFKADDYNTLGDALTAIGATKASLLVYSNLNVNETVTVPSNVTLLFYQGGKFTIGATYTVTINGNIQAGIYQIFAGDGTVDGDIKVKYAYPQWFGATGNGSIDDTAALQKTLDLGINVYIPDGTYKLTDELRPVSNQEIIGESLNAVLQPTVDAKNGITIENKENVSLRRFKMQFNVSGQTTSYGIGIKFWKSYTCVAQNVNVIDCGSFGIDCDSLLSGKDIQQHLIENCYVEGAGIYGIYARAYVETQGRTIIRNNFVKDSGRLNDALGRGIMFAGISSCVAEHNTVDGATEYGIRVYTDVTFPVAEDNVIQYNHIKNVGVGSSKSSMIGIYIYAAASKRSIIRGNIIEGIGYLGVNDIGIAADGSYNIVEENRIFGTTGTGIAISSYANDVHLIRKNLISGLAKGISSAYNVSNGNHYRDTIAENIILVANQGVFLSNCVNPVVIANTIIISGTASGDFGIEASGLVRELIKDNYISGGYRAFEISTTGGVGHIASNFCTGQTNLTFRDYSDTSVKLNNMGVVGGSGWGQMDNQIFPNDSMTVTPIPDTSGASLVQIEQEVNKVKAMLRQWEFLPV